MKRPSVAPLTIVGITGVAGQNSAVSFSKTAAFVQGVLGIEELSMVLKQPGDPGAIFIPCLFIRLEHQENIAVRPVVFLLEAD